MIKGQECYHLTPGFLYISWQNKTEKWKRGNKVYAVWEEEINSSSPKTWTSVKNFIVINETFRSSDDNKLSGYKMKMKSQFVSNITRRNK